MGVTRRGALLSDGSTAQGACSGAQKNVDLCSEKVCAYMATTRTGGYEQRPELYATFFIFHELALLQPVTRTPTYQYLKHTSAKVRRCYQIEQGDAQKLLRS